MTSGLGWAVWTDGRIKFTTGGGLPYKIRDIPVAPDITGLLRSGVLAPGSHLALVTRRGKVLRIDPAAVNPQGAAGNGVAGVKLAADGDEVIAALPLTCGNGEAILSISEKGWKVTEVADIPVKGRGGAGVGFHPFVGGETALLCGGGLGDRVRARQQGRPGREACQGVDQGFRRRRDAGGVTVRHRTDVDPTYDYSNHTRHIVNIARWQCPGVTHCATPPPCRRWPGWMPHRSVSARPRRRPPLPN